MKRNYTCTTAAIISTCLVCSSIVFPSFAGEGINKSDITLDYIAEKLVPANITKNTSTFAFTATYSNTGNSYEDGHTLTHVYAEEDGIYKLSEFIEYSDGYFSNVYFSSDPDDLSIYITASDGDQIYQKTEADAESYFKEAIFNISEDNSVLNSIEENGDTFLVSVKPDDAEASGSFLFTINAESSLIDQIIITEPSPDSSEDMTLTMVFDYSDDLEIDYSAKEINIAKAEALANTTFEFSTVDINGNPVNSDILEGAKLVLVNYWEPWCGPCVRELPSLEKLYENYKDQGLVILGIYSALNMQEDAEAIVESNNITYPVLQCDSFLARFQETFVPHTFFLDEEGHILMDDSYEGSKDYDTWEKIIKDLGIGGE